MKSTTKTQSLSDVELTKRSVYERRIRDCDNNNQRELSELLRAIKHERLWRDHDTYETYCKKTLGYHPSWVYRILNFGEFLDDLSVSSKSPEPKALEPADTPLAAAVTTSPVGEILPSNERQCRELFKLPRNKRIDIWQVAMRDSGGQMPDGKLLKRLVQTEREKVFSEANGDSENSIQPLISISSAIVDPDILHGDMLDLLPTFQQGSIDVICTSVPFNVGLAYDGHPDNWPHQEYLAQLTKWIIAMVRTLKCGGRCVIHITDTQAKDKSRENFHPLAFEVLSIMRKVERPMLLLNYHIVDKGDVGEDHTAWGSYCSPSFPHARRQHEWVLVFSCETYKHDGNADAATIRDDEFDLATRTIWRGLAPEPDPLLRQLHPCPMSQPLVERILRLYSFAGNTVLDPFAGIMTVPLVARRLGRKVKAIEQSSRYVDIGKLRLHAPDQLKAAAKAIRRGGHQPSDPASSSAAEAA